MSNTSIGSATDEVPATEIRYSIDEVAQLVIRFEAQWSRPPNLDEFNALVEDRARRDVLYREALALGLDKDDEIVKRRMAQKMQFLVEDIAAAREPATEDLKAWFAENTELFAMPPPHLFLTGQLWCKRASRRRGRAGRA